jgi:hypothetical protein
MMFEMQYKHQCCLAWASVSLVSQHSPVVACRHSPPSRMNIRPIRLQFANITCPRVDGSSALSSFTKISQSQDMIKEQGSLSSHEKKCPNYPLASSKTKLPRHRIGLIHHFDLVLALLLRAKSELSTSMPKVQRSAMASPPSPTSPTSLPTETTTLDAAQFYELFSTKKPSILLHAGSTKADPVVGIAKLHSQHSKFNTIGIGNPEAILEEGEDKAERMVWERLQRMKKWNYRWYEFEFGGKVFTWRRTEDRWYKFLKNMELRAGKEEDGELVAAWRGSQRMNVKRGSFFIKRNDEQVE